MHILQVMQMFKRLKVSCAKSIMFKCSTICRMVSQQNFAQAADGGPRAPSHILQLSVPCQRVFCKGKGPDLPAGPGSQLWPGPPVPPPLSCQHGSAGWTPGWSSPQSAWQTMGSMERYVTDPLAGVTSCRPTMLYVATSKTSVTQLAALVA